MMHSDSGFWKMGLPRRLRHTSGPTNAPAPWRHPAAMTLGLVGIALYNWWLVVALSGRRVTTPDELFSDLEAVGRPDAAILQRLDLTAGLVILAALLLRGRHGPDGPRSEWPWLVAFAVSGAVGGHFSYVCPEGLSATCRSQEWRLALPPHHYILVLAGITEFAAATVAIYLARHRTRLVEEPVTWAICWTWRALLVAYPLLAVAYITDRFGALVEPAFFVCFSAMVAAELFEADRVVLPDSHVHPYWSRVVPVHLVHMGTAGRGRRA